MIQTSVLMMFQQRRQEDCENENKNYKTVLFFDEINAVL